MKYLEEYEDLIKYLTCFHLLENKPQLLILEDLQSYTNDKKKDDSRKALLLHLLNNVLSSLEYLPAHQEMFFYNILVTYKTSNVIFEREINANNNNNN